MSCSDLLYIHKPRLFQPVGLVLYCYIYLKLPRLECAHAGDTAVPAATDGHRPFAVVDKVLLCPPTVDLVKLRQHHTAPGHVSKVADDYYVWIDPESDFSLEPISLFSVCIVKVTSVTKVYASGSELRQCP
jgi:hypothetical protein